MLLLETGEEQKGWEAMLNMDYLGRDAEGAEWSRAGLVVGRYQCLHKKVRFQVAMQWAQHFKNVHSPRVVKETVAPSF